MDTGQDERLVIALRSAAHELTGLRSIHGLEQMLGQVVSSAVVTIPGMDAGSISMTRNGRIEAWYPTSDLVGKIDDQQSELHEGPCISALEDPPASGTVLATDLARAGAQHWPHFAPVAVDAGYRALMSTQLATPAVSAPP